MFTCRKCWGAILHFPHFLKIDPISKLEQISYIILLLRKLIHISEINTMEKIVIELH